MAWTIRVSSPGKGKGSFFFLSSTNSRPTLGPNQALTQCVYRFLSPVKGSRGMKLTHSHLYNAEDESESICTSATIYAHGIFKDTLLVLLYSKLFSAKQLWAMPLLDVKRRRKLMIDLNLLYLKFSGKNERPD